LANIARQNLAEWENVEVVTTTFEDFDAPASSIDVVVSATAFHWVNPNISFSKAARLLDEGGRLALITNAHSRGGTHAEERMAISIGDLHRRLASEIGEWHFPTAEEIRHRATEGGDIAAVWARVERKMPDAPSVEHLFGTPTVKTYPRMVTYRTDEFLAMLASQSQYAVMERARRDRLFDGIAALIDEHLDGTVTKEYVSVLAVAPRTGTTWAR
jgi:SAM-dependent methyltransferase